MSSTEPVPLSDPPKPDVLRPLGGQLFAHVYDLGRILKSSNDPTKVQLVKFEEFEKGKEWEPAPGDPAAKDLVEGARDAVRSIVRYLVQKQKFAPEFVELSLFDPQDLDGSRFYSLLAGRSAKAIEDYVAQMEVSLKSIREAERGALFPNPWLYENSYIWTDWTSEVPVGSAGPLDEAWRYAIGAFDSQAGGAEQTKWSREVGRHAENFLRDLRPGLSGAGLGVILPLTRPASLSKAADRDEVRESLLLRGGGLVVLGQWLADADRDPLKFVAELKEVLHRELVAASNLTLHTTTQLDRVSDDFVHQGATLLTQQLAYLRLRAAEEKKGFPGTATGRVSPETAQALARCWHLFTLTESYSDRDMKPLAPVSTIPGLSEWAGKSPNDLMVELMRLAAGQTLHKLYRYEQTPGGVAASAWDDEADPVGRLLDAEMVVDVSRCLEWPAWVGYKGFVVCFHHAFWQAAYHAFQTLAAGHAGLAVPAGGKTFLALRSTRDSVAVVNAAPPAAPNPIATKDRAFFNRIEKRLGGTFRVDGPRPSADGDGWETVIRRVS